MNTPRWLSELGNVPELSKDRGAWDQDVSSFFGAASTTAAKEHSLTELKKSLPNSKELGLILDRSSEVSALSDALSRAAAALVKAIGEEAQHFQHTLVDVIGRAKAAKLMLQAIEGSLAREKKLSNETNATWRAVIETIEEAGMQMSRILVHLCGPKSAGALAAQVAQVVRGT